MRIPKEVRSCVEATLYEEAEFLDWANLTVRQRSAQYTKWVDDPEVGGRICEYLSPSAARVWIKDGPMKEWSRSLSGVGKHGTLIEGAEDTASQLARKALGEGWEVDKDTLRVKPLRVVARMHENEAVLTWSPASGLKHLVWAALTASSEGDARDWVLCVVETFTKPTPANEKQMHARLAKRCGLRIVYLSR